jgi:hypothetical protein
MEHLGQNKENNLHPVKTITYGLSVKIGAYVVVCVYDVINDKSEHFKIVKVSEKFKKRIKGDFWTILVFSPFADFICIFVVFVCVCAC